MNNIAKIHRAHVYQCNVKYDDPWQWERALKANEGFDVDITISRHVEKRSNPQNRYYFGVVIAILCQEFNGIVTEADKTNIHKGLGEKFLKYHDEKTGLYYIKSTTELDVQQFENYLTQCRQWAAQEHGINILEPNEIDLLTLEER